MIEVDWNNDIQELKESIPIFKPVILKMKDGNLIFSTDGIFFDHKDRFIINTNSHNIFPEEVIAWSILSEKPKEKGSRVYLDFSESELEELQELFEYLKPKLEESFDESISTFRKSYERKLNNLKKFQDKFSKVEF